MSGGHTELKPETALNVVAFSTPAANPNAVVVHFAGEPTHADRDNLLAAINAWNTRTPDPHLLTILREAREALDWARNEIRQSTRYESEEQFWNCYDRARTTLAKIDEVLG